MTSKLLYPQRSRQQKFSKKSVFLIINSNNVLTEDLSQNECIYEELVYEYLMKSVNNILIIK
jgi:hypothetical protein